MGGKRSAVILGGGVAGLAAGWRLAGTGQWDVTVVERAPVIGGLCATFRHGEMLLDHGPHKCFSTMPEVMAELKRLMGGELLEHRKRNSIRLFGRYLDYPLKLGQLLSGMGPQDAVASAASAITERLRGFVRPGGADSYERYVVSRFGRRLYGLVFQPLAEKVWGDPPSLSADIARTRLSSTGFADVAARLLKLKRETALTNADVFYYPRRGFGRIPERMAEEITARGGRIATSTSPLAVHHEDGRVTGTTVERDGLRERLPCDLLISTIPFDALGALMQQHRSEANLEALLREARQLQYRHLILVYVVVGCDELTRDHWIFYPERSVVFGRIFEQKRLSGEMVPRGVTAICCDMVDSEEGDRWRAGDTTLGERCVADLRSSSILNGEPVRETFVKRVKRFYPRYDLRYRETLSRLYGRMKRYRNLLSTGRIGLYNYNNSDHCVDMALRIEEGLRAGRAAPHIMDTLEQRVQGYRIVD